MSAKIISFPTLAEEPKEEIEIPVVADCKKGFTSIPNALLDALCHVDLTGRQTRVLMTIIRKTYGFQKKVDRITSTQVAKLMNYSGALTHIRKDIRTLKKRKILVEVDGKVGPNPVISEWFFDKEDLNETAQKQSVKGPNLTPERTKNELFSEPNRSPQKKINKTKENIKNNTVENLDRVCEESIQYLNFKACKNFHGTQANLSMVSNLLEEGFTPSDIRKVIDRQTVMWLKDPKRNQYLRPKTLFNPVNFEGYLNAEEDTIQQATPPQTKSLDLVEHRHMISQALDDVYNTDW